MGNATPYFYGAIAPSWLFLPGHGAKPFFFHRHTVPKAPFPPTPPVPKGSRDMVICPQCIQANPSENRFCQYCGTPLTVPCPQCEAPVRLQQDQCDICQTWLNQPLQALVLDGSIDLFQSRETLDEEGRYHLADPPEIRAQTFPWLKVMDTAPDASSYLEETLQQETEAFHRLEATDKAKISDPQLWVDMGIPAIARHYLSLQDSFSTFPKLYDAWIRPDHQILLFEHRQDLLIPLEAYCEAETPLLEQLLQWCFQMVQLWRELVPIQCCRTLLEPTNLYLDEDQSLVVEQLLNDDPENPPALEQLPQLWQTLFSLGEQSEWQPLYALTETAQEGSFNTVSRLKKALRDLAPEGIAELLTPGELEAVELQPGDVMTLDDLPLAADLNPEELALDIEGLDESSTSEDGPAYPLDIENSEGNIASADFQSFTFPEEEEASTVVLPMNLVSLEDAGLTDIGQERDHNEDYFGIRTKIEKQENLLGRQIQGRGLYVVCDGMGGHAAGEVASAMAVETIQDFFQEHWGETLPDEAMIHEGIIKANDVLYRINVRNSRSGSGRMGTTLVLLLVQDNQVAIAHVGDSRIYRVSRKWNLEQVTVDHEVGQREIHRGVDPDLAYGRPDAYQLTQALGPRENSFVEPDINFIHVNEDCLFLLCSDGLSDNDLIEETWKESLLPLLSSRANLEEGVRELIALGNKYNGHDNITAVVVRLRVRPNLGLQ
ncbi:serine/threonine phosphatase [Picosynechococcus sp. NKBG15041c]|uniref:serine/threonine phosphatase n=1 Tax=Picosynechococcus sp. NKBG15041c TaxID=1407650 RepID=UPI00042A2915|nr:serine/threonine phosphatase [Picosynechococcus sp. NKBG15041c]